MLIGKKIWVLRVENQFFTQEINVTITTMQRCRAARDSYILLSSINIKPALDPVF